MLNPTIIALIPLLPLASFLLLGLFGRKYLRENAGWIGTLSLLVSTILAFQTAYNYFFISGKVNGVYQQIILLKYTWLQFAPGISIDMSILLDPISVMMIVIVTFISLMVHIYSLGYMKGEVRFSTYYAFLSLFTFSMLGLVLSGNIFQTYIFWELVGISSFLLIGFYFERPSAVAAAKKAFIVTRFADLGFLIGILILSFGAGTLDFRTLVERLTTSTQQLQSMVTYSFLGASALTWGLLLVFAGGAGKSAMFPLHIWLPDAMEGPTPVSALIHAATMVVAGVYLVARLFPIFALSCPAALMVVGYVGAFSAIFAAVIACTQTDIKRVLAYSTISQIGFMMLSLGVSGYGGEHGLGFMASMFHLFTHATFKALLFLCAGSVIHFVHSNEMKDMGGLRKGMPGTHAVFFIACLAIAGIPPLAGFFSKEEILTAAFEHNKIIYAVALFTSGITAFYMFRLYFSIFWRKESFTHSTHDHDEGPLTMMVPLFILGGLTLVVGFIPFGNFVSSDGLPIHTVINAAFSAAPVLAALTGICIAWILYKTENDKADKIAFSLGAIYTAARNKFYIDEIYLFITKRVIFNLVGKPSAWVDKNIVDGGVNYSAEVTEDTSDFIKGWQSGKMQQYALWFFVGVIVIAVAFIYTKK